MTLKVGGRRRRAASHLSICSAERLTSRRKPRDYMALDKPLDGRGVIEIEER
jgi:hypothetical protein